MKQPPEVKAVFDSYPAGPRKQLLAVRSLLLDIAASSDVIGPIEETLKWGEPAYLTSKTKSGTTIRLAWKESIGDDVGIYFNCQTSLIDNFRTLFPNERYEGNRAILLDASGTLPSDVLAQCLEMALLYHRSKKKRKQLTSK